MKAPHAQVLFISETVLLGLSAILFLLGIYLSFNRYVGNLPNYLVAFSIFFCAVAVIAQFSCLYLDTRNGWSNKDLKYWIRYAVNILLVPLEVAGVLFLLSL